LSDSRSGGLATMPDLRLGMTTMVASPRLGLAPNMVVRPKVLGSGNPCQTQVNNKQIEDNCAL